MKDDVYIAKDPEHRIEIFSVTLPRRPNALSRLATLTLEKLYALCLNEMCILTCSLTLHGTNTNIVCCRSLQSLVGIRQDKFNNDRNL